MATLNELQFRLKVTRINRHSIDKLVAFTDSSREDIQESMSISIQASEGPDVATFHAMVEFPALEFSLYSLAMVHCYSILENNRKLTCEEMPGISDEQKKALYKIKEVTKFLSSIGIEHKKLGCYETMDEFRQVNNAIKHNRFGLGTSVKTEESKIKYDAKALKSLYLNKAKDLETYLSDLYERTKSQRLNVPA
jgi:hypothetical protein